MKCTDPGCSSFNQEDLSISVIAGTKLITGITGKNRDYGIVLAVQQNKNLVRQKLKANYYYVLKSNG